MSLFHFKGESIEFACDSSDISLTRTPFNDKESLLLHLKGIIHVYDLSERDFVAIRDRLLSEGQPKRCCKCGLDIHEQDLSYAAPDLSTPMHLWCRENSRAG